MPIPKIVATHHNTIMNANFKAYDAKQKNIMGSSDILMVLRHWNTLTMWNAEMVISRKTDVFLYDTNIDFYQYKILSHIDFYI